MTLRDIHEALAGSAGEVLESMFFSGLADEAADDTGAAGLAVASGEPWLAVRLSFRGNPSGRFEVRLPRATACRLAANFLGADEDALTEAQTGDVICELANMLCGSLLSRLEKDARFELGHPELGRADAAESQPAGGLAPTSHRLLNLEEGRLDLWLEL